MDDLERIELRLAEIATEQAELVSAAKVLRRFRSQNRTVNGTRRGKKKAGKTITEMAKEILAESTADGLHYSEIAKLAIERGYKGRKKSTDDTIRKSFWATLKRESEFKGLGDGRFKLK